MKLFFLCALLAASILLLEAIPSAKQLYKNVHPRVGNEKADIWKDCTDPSDPAKLLNLTINPDPPVRGQYVKWDLEIDLSKEVESGQIEISLKSGIIPFNQKLDLCQVVQQGGGSCPLEPGKHTISPSIPVPSIAPPGHYSGHGYLKDGSGAELVCIQVDFDLK